MNCQQHGIPFVLKPGGVSKKTGKPYNAFWSCPGRNEDGSYCSNKPPKDYKPKREDVFNSELAHSGKTMDFERRDDKRADGQSWGNAKTNSVNWAIAMYQKGDMKSDQMKSWIEKCANWIHNLEPKEVTTVVPPITEREKIEELTEAFGGEYKREEDTIDLSTIPF